MQHEPWLPTPAFLSFSEGVQPSTLPYLTVNSYALYPWARQTYLAVDELQISRALRVTVTSTVLSAGLVILVLGETTIGIHGDEVQSTVQTTSEVRNIHVEGELLVQQLEHLVGVLVLHHIQTRTDVGSGDEAQRNGIGVGGYTVSTFVVCTFYGTVGRTSLIVGAEALVPLL